MPLPTDDAEVLGLLEAEGLLRRDSFCHRTTRTWQGAMSRAAWLLLRSGDDGSEGDLRAPIALALLEIFDDRFEDEELARIVELMTPIEAAELAPHEHLARSEPTPDR